MECHGTAAMQTQTTPIYDVICHTYIAFPLVWRLEGRHIRIIYCFLSIVFTSGLIKQSYNYIDRWMDGWIDGRTDGWWTDGQTDRETYRQKSIETDRQTDRQTYRQTDRQTDIETDGKTDRQTDMQTDRHADRHTEREKERERERFVDKYRFYKSLTSPFVLACFMQLCLFPEMLRSTLENNFMFICRCD